MIPRAAPALVVWGVLLTFSCMETRRSLGEDCLKDGDCLSGVCSQLRCATTAPTLDTPVVAEAAEAGMPSASSEADGTADEPSPDAPGDASRSDD